MNKVHSFFNNTSNYLHQSFGIKVRSEIIASVLGEPRGQRMLDVGCGNGSVTMQFVRFNRVTFLDLSENMIELAKRNVQINKQDSNADFLVGSFTDIELQNNYDFIFAIGLLAHVPSIDDCIERISYLLKPGGKAIIQFSNYNHWLTRFNILNSTNREYRINKITYDELEFITKKHRLSKQSEVQFSFILPGMGKLPDKLLYWYSKWVVKSKMFSKLGTDYIWVLSKI